MKDLTDLDQLREHLRQSGLLAKKSLGQNFLVDRHAVHSILVAAELHKDDAVLEVGPGPGVLSLRIAPLVRELTAVEIDARMLRPWKHLMAAFPQASIVHQDVLKFVPDDQPYKLVANIPYYITSPILKHFLRNQKIRRPEIIVLLLQREVAERIVDAKRPPLLSWEIRIFGDAELVARIPRSSFYPSPKVDSAILKIRLRKQPSLSETDLVPFFLLLSRAYKQPRKTLMNNLTAGGVWQREPLLQFLKKRPVSDTIRPHELTFDDWKALFSALKGS